MLKVVTGVSIGSINRRLRGRREDPRRRNARLSTRLWDDLMLEAAAVLDGGGAARPRLFRAAGLLRARGADFWTAADLDLCLRYPPACW